MQIFESDLHFLYAVASACRDKSTGRDYVWQVAPFQGRVEFSERSLEAMGHFEEVVYENIRPLAIHGRLRARRAYGDHAGTITKPNYFDRLRHRSTESQRSQLELLEERFVAEPYSGGLAFSVFEPEDLFRRQRPGYVPCLISGSFLLHEGELQLNAFFRSVSIVEFGIFDLVFLRKLQERFLEAIYSYPEDRFPKRHGLQEIRAGSLNIHFSRVIVQDRLARGKKGFVRRADVFEQWLEMLVSCIDRYPE